MLFRFSNVLFIALFCSCLLSSQQAYSAISESQLLITPGPLLSGTAKGTEEFTTILQGALTKPRVLAPGKMEKGLRNILEALVSATEYAVYYKLGARVRHELTRQPPSQETLQTSSYDRLQYERVRENIISPIRPYTSKPSSFVYGGFAAVAGKALMNNYPQKFVQSAIDKLKKLIFSTRISTIIKKDIKTLSDDEKYLLKVATAEFIDSLVILNFIDKNQFSSNLTEPIAMRLQKSLPSTLDTVLGSKVSEIRKGIYTILTSAKGLEFSWDGTTLKTSFSYVTNYEPDSNVKMFYDLFKAIEKFVL